MRILFFIECLHSGGKERRLTELLKGLKKYPEITAELVLTKKGIHYTEILNLGMKIHIIERKYLKKDPRLFFLFYKICKKFKPDIIHVWGNMPAFYAIPAKVLLNIPMFNNQISDAPIKPKGGILSYKLNFMFSNLIIANSKAGLNSYQVSEKKGKVIYNGFDFTRLNGLADNLVIREKFGIHTKYVIAMIATFYWGKDYKTYINASIEVLKIRNDITFLCIGAMDFSDYQKMVPSSFSDNIKFLGVQKNIESIINICDIGVLTTFTEGIPNSVMEFMALGKPVIVTDGGGTSELLIHEINGYLISTGDHKELVERILQLINCDNCRKEMGKASVLRIGKEFSISNMIESYYKTYKDFLYK